MKCAREQFGIDVLQGRVADNRQHLREVYDVVAAWDVLEHVRDPARFLRECATFLRTGGLLCISTLDIDTWFPRAMGKHWPWLLDMHLFYFDRATMKDLLYRNGFALVAAEPYVHYARLGYALDGLAASLPRPLDSGIRTVGKFMPRDLEIRVALGDIKLYVARKRQSPSLAACNH